MSALPPARSNSSGVPLLKSGSELASKSTKSSTETRVYTRRYTPRCPLAKHAIHQMVALDVTANEIVKRMGYPRQHTVAAKERLRTVLCSPYMGLDGCYLDPYYDAEGFLLKLFELLKVEPEYYRGEMQSINHSLSNI